MLSSLSWLALEVKHIPPAREFYAGALGMDVRREADHELALAAGETDLLLRRPAGVPRGGVHTHFALSVPAAEYDDWWDRLEADFDLREHRFGDARSLYLYDPDGNCVELGQRDVDGPGIDGIFEVVLEVTDLDRATSFYADLGFETVDRGEDRRRVRMAGPMALELWEPHLGIAEARGGLHVDLGFESPDPGAVASAVEDRARSVESTAAGRRIVDPDGHHLTIRPE